MAADPRAPRTVSPAPPLSQWVDCFWIQEGYVRPHARERVMPAATLDLVFVLDADGRATSGVSGPRSTASVLETSRPFSAIGVHFRPGGGRRFFGVPVGELHDLSVPLDAVWGRFAAQVSDRLWEAGSADSRFRALDDALRQRADDRAALPPAVAYAVDAIARSQGGRPMRDIVDRIGMSPRRFSDVFRDHVGLSPKLFCRLTRFTAALAHMERHAKGDLADAALACGYFDQAHFNHDFRSFSGITPSTYVRGHTSRTHVADTWT